MKCTCGWVNSWRDSGDRGAAQHEHDFRECPHRSTCNVAKRVDNKSVYCTAAPHSGEHFYA